MLIVADNINIMDPAIAQALERFDPEPIPCIVKRCVYAGARILDINAGSLVRKIALETAFLPMLAAAGLDMVLTNVFHYQTLSVAKLCGELLNDGVVACIRNTL